MSTANMAGGPTTSAVEAHGSTILKNASLITAANMLLRGLHFLFRIYVVRRLGGDAFGQYATVLAFVGLFQIAAELGISQYVMREIARDRRRTGVLFWNLVAVRLLLALAGVVVITCLGVGAGYSSTLVLGIFLYTWTFVIAAFEAPLEVVLAGHERLDLVSGLQIVGQVAFVALGTYVLWSGHGLLALVAVGLLGMVPQLALAIRMVIRYKMVSGPVRITPGLWPGMARAGLPFGWISLALTVAYSIDSVMLSMWWASSIVGWYNAAYGLARSLLFFFDGFSRAIVPSLARVYPQSAQTVATWYANSVRFIILASLPIAVGGMLVAHRLIPFLYTVEFLPAVIGFQIIVWDVPLLMFVSFCGNMTTVTNQERAAARIYTLNAVANVALNLIAIPRFGLIGAAVVTVLTDLIGAIQFHFLLRESLQPNGMMSFVWRVSVCAGLMGLAVKAAESLPLLLQIGLGAIAYGGLLLTLKVVRRAEWVAFRGLWRKQVPAELPSLTTAEG